MLEIAQRPLAEIRISRMKSDNELIWLQKKAKFLHAERFEYILLLPHPKHKVLGGEDINEYLKDCPETLSISIRDVYATRELEREKNFWENNLNLEDDYGFVLIAYV